MKTVDRYMTASPHTIGAEQSVDVAIEMMRAYGVRHLPVRHCGRLVGVIGDREIALINPMSTKEQNVGAHMNPGPYVVSPQTPLHVVARDMAEHRFEIAVVQQGGDVVGVFTTVDLARALSEVLREVWTHPASNDTLDHQPSL